MKPGAALAPSPVGEESFASPIEENPSSPDELSPLLHPSAPTQDKSRWYNRDAKGRVPGMAALEQWRKSPLSTLQVLWTYHGTVLVNPVLWVEQFIGVMIFTMIAVILRFFSPPGFPQWVDTTEGNIRSFTTLLSGLAGFLLTFYVSLCINRWWSLRLSGIGAMMNSCSELSLFLSRCAGAEPDLITTVHRYARASLLLIWMEHHHSVDNKLDQLAKFDILTKDEVGKLMEMENVPESIWTWVTEIVVMLHSEGKIKEPPLYTFLLGKCNEGRAGVAAITGYLTTPIPRLYVHIITLMVKLHNVFLCVLMGMIGADKWQRGQGFLLFQVVIRIFLMPLLYNAIILVCEELSDPFSGEVGDFPIKEYLSSLEQKGRSYVEAGRHLPAWLAERRSSKSSNAV